jgi:hypothetical protein
MIVMVPERRLLTRGGVGSPRGADFVLASDVLRMIAADIRGRLRRDRSVAQIGDLESTWWTNTVRRRYGGSLVRTL